MAEKRMFAKSIVLTDAFLDMPMSARCLYFTLGMLADDDGFVGSPKSIMRQCGASQDDLMVLLSKRFVLGFDSGVIVIKHWRINNYLQADRYHPTNYKEELAMLMLDEKGSYTEVDKACIQPVSNLDTTCIQDVYADKNSIDKTRLEEISKEKKSIAHAYGEYGWIKLTDEQYSKLITDIGEDELLRCIKYIDESAQQTGNKNKWKDWNLTIRKCSRDGWGKTNTQTQPQPQQKGRNIKAACNSYPSIDFDCIYSAIDKI